MGWLFGHETKQEVIDEVTRSWEPLDRPYFRKVVDKSLVGSHLWVVWGRFDKATGIEDEAERFLILYLLRKSGGRWGYKDIDEAAGPFYYNCPKRLLDLAPVTNQEWRDKVLAYHESKRRKVKVSDLKAGQRVRLKDKYTHTVFLICDIDKLTRCRNGKKRTTTRVFGFALDADGKKISYYKIPHSNIVEILAEPIPESSAA